MMKIGELSRRSGVATSAIRFYEEQGLLTPSSRTASGYREYGDEALDRLEMMQLLKKLGFSLDVIGGMFYGVGKCLQASALEQTDVRLREVEAMQAQLAAQHRELLELRHKIELKGKACAAAGTVWPPAAPQVRRRSGPRAGSL